MENPEKKKCPYCAEEIRAEAIKCRYCGSVISTSPLSEAVTRAWYRSRRDKVIAGVCMGLARQFNVSVTLIRLAFILGTFFGGWGVLIYITLWFIMPKEPVARWDEYRLERGQGIEGERDQGSGPASRLPQLSSLSPLKNCGGRLPRESLRSIADTRRSASDAPNPPVSHPTQWLITKVGRSPKEPNRNKARPDDGGGGAAGAIPVPDEICAGRLACFGAQTNRIGTRG